LKNAFSGNRHTARMLTVQYRMHEHIMGFSSQNFYGGQLQAHPSVRHAGLEAYDPALMLFRPTFPWNSSTRLASASQELTIPESRSTANPEEAGLLLKRLVQLLGVHDPADRAQGPLSIGVIAPYRAQINCLRDAIEDNSVLNPLAAEPPAQRGHR
jgi:ATP-dependent RNA/DNA helicase IGHMBP2